MRTGRRLALVLWPAILGYSTLVVLHAYSELTEPYQVQGLFRSYAPPYLDYDGWVIDPRQTDLFTEIQTRFAPGRDAAPPAAATPDAWRTALEALGLTVRATERLTDLPQVVFEPDGPRLIFGAFAWRRLVFDPRRGTVMVDAEAQARPRLHLVGAQEPPF